MYKLMIVDDETLERQVLRMFVEQSKLEIDTIVECANGVDAVKTALLEQPNICILDIKMPGLNGLEAMNQIKAVNQNCKVIFSSAYNYFDYAVKAMQMGALDFMTKPVKKETILRVLTKAIDQIDEEQNLEAYHNRVSDITYVLEKRILRELVTGQTDEETLWFLDVMKFDELYGNAFFLRLARNIDETEKAAISKILRAELSAAGYSHLLFVHHRSIDLLIFTQTAQGAMQATAQIEQILNATLKSTHLEAKIGNGLWAEDLLQIELAYIEAKEMVGETVAAFVPETVVQIATKPQAERTGVPAEIDAICAYIKEQYSEKITLDSITESVGFSKYYASRLFKKYMGTTIIDYLIQVRIEKAKELLTNSDYSIKQISYMIGYQDPNYFTWSFKKCLGVSPIKYRYFQNLSN